MARAPQLSAAAHAVGYAAGRAARCASTAVSVLRNAIFTALLVTGFSGCGNVATLPIAAGTGMQPTLPAPVTTLVPTVNIAPAKGWPAGRTPTPAAGLRVQAFAEKLDHPRWLYTLPNGDVLVAETNAPAKPDDSPGIKGFVMQIVMKIAGAATTSANRITLLRDSDGDGVADLRTVLLAGLNSPFGMALIGDQLYIANTDAVVRFPYQTGDTHITAAAVKVVDLPGGPINHHWTKNILASADGRKLYVTVGSNSNVAERGMAVEAGRAAIWEIDLATNKQRIFASGLRNPVGMAWDPTSRELWTVVNERDELGSDLVPDYLTSVADGAFYGWPYSYFGQHVDERVKPAQPQLVATARSPDYALGSHTASLGLVAAHRSRLSGSYTSGMFIGQHGSWNRRPHSGYKVVFVPFLNGRPASDVPIDILTGFLSAQKTAYGRPVGLAIDNDGALLVADDVGNIVWRMTASQRCPKPCVTAISDRAQQPVDTHFRFPAAIP